ncbi:hypothetical protein COB72_01865 [bacterium]|nr:MAG: hypothetical protein COB72_01865 [bacterium]
MGVVALTPTTHTPGDQRRFGERSSRLCSKISRDMLSSRTDRMREILSEMEQMASTTLRAKPGVIHRLEAKVAECNEMVKRELDNAKKYANRPAKGSMVIRSGDSAEFKSIEDGGNG